MKTLYLLRHAEAESVKGGGDFERDLTARGFEASQALGRAMREKNYAPQFTACSSARRAARTLDGVLKAIKIPAPLYDKKIYHATPGDLLAIIRGFNDAFQSALVVGHNPTIHEAASALAADEPGEHLARLALGYAPGTLAVFSCSIARWRDLRPGESGLEDLVGG